MDLNTVTEVIRRPTEPPGALWRPGDAWLAGGTWLFSDPQPKLRRLIDLVPLGWSELDTSQAGLHIGAMCTIGGLYAFAPPAQWPAARLIPISCEAFLSSFKVWNAATVGGNICMSLPAGPMITLTVALEAEYRLQAVDGTERSFPAADFVTGDHRNVLAPPANCCAVSTFPTARCASGSPIAYSRSPHWAAPPCSWWAPKAVTARR